LASPPGAAPVAPPATDFFAAQDAARARSRGFFALFALCVVAVVASIDVYVALVVMLHQQHARVQGGGEIPTFREQLLQVPREVTLASTAATLALVLGGSIRRTRQLSADSGTLAQSLGARAVTQDATDPREKVLRNVVEEMALASAGLPPALFVLDSEPAINAFAGTTRGEAFVVVTRGALERLTRDEQQALVAYGLGEVRNGDAEVNLRLIGWLAGITAIADLGVRIMKAPVYAMRGKGDEDASDLRKGVLAFSLFVAFFGSFVAVIGYAGLLLARFVRSRAGRQRVYLADATAVQYTRNPAALLNLLRRIDGERAAGTLAGPYREEFGPLLFVPGVRRLCLATHPRLKRRIARLARDTNA
jgi:Zn-dependent protease with chaperone function